MRIFIINIILSLFAFNVFAQFSILQEWDKGIIIEMRLGNLSFIEEQTPWGLMKKPVIEDGTWVLKSGYPELQKYTTSIVIPFTGSTIVNIIESDYYDIQNIKICPSKGSIKRDIDPQTVPYTKSKVYEQDEFWPQNNAYLRDPYILREFRGQTLVVIPFAYNPVKNILRVYTRFIIEITFSDKPGKNQLNILTSQKTDREFFYIYEQHFLNFPSTRYTPVDENGSMLIICHGPFIQSMQPFVLWKNQKGIPTEIVNVSTIGTNSNDIKNFIENYYWQNNLKYLLLVGDAQHVPPMMLQIGPSDNAYGYIVGNDHYPDIFVGRFSAETIAHVATQVERSIRYEKYPQPSAQWYSKGAGIASQEGPGHNNLFDHEHVRLLRTKLLQYTYTDVYEHYEGTQGGSDLPGDPTPDQVLNNINNGLSIINYTGHGGVTGWATSGFDNNHINQLTNIDQLPFIWSVACVNGAFVGYTCFAEAWMRATYNNQPTGSIANLMSTINQYWNEPMSGQLEMVDILIESYQFNKPRSFGGISMNGCMKMNDDYGQTGYDMTDTWTIFGDPSIVVRTAPPNTITASHPTEAALGQDAIEIICNTNGALVCLSINGQILTKGLVQNNSVYLTFDPLNNIDTIDVVITAFNHKPYIGQIEIISPTGPWLKKFGVLINDQNVNQLIEYNEFVRLDLAIKNIGVEDAHNVTAKLIPTSSNTYINLIKDSAFFGTIEVNQVKWQFDAFAFNVANNIPNNTQVGFKLLMSTPDTTWISYLWLNIAAPQFTVQQVSIQEIQGNMNGRLDPGERVYLQFHTNNTSLTTTPLASCTLSSASGYLSIITGIIQPGIFQPNETKVVSFEVQISPQTPNGISIPFVYQCSAGLYQLLYNTSIVCGLLVEDWELNSFTQFPWNTSYFGDVPWYIVGQGQAYEGEYCVRSGQITDDQKSILQITMTAATADTISFYRKVSCEQGSIYGTWWDFLEFSINNQVKGRWDGEKDWERVAYYVPAGIHTYRWSYVKDYIISEGADASWIDFIIFPPILIDNTGIELEQSSFSIKCYPSPTRDVINIEIIGNVYNINSFAISDFKGRIIYNEYVVVDSNASFLTKSHSLKDLQSGTYFIILQTKQKTIVYPFLKIY